MRNFFTKTLLQRRTLTFWWFIGITAMILLTVSFYHSFKDSDIESLFKTLPASVQHLTGTAGSFKTVDGYLRQQVFSLRLPMLTIILAITLLVGISAGDEQKGLLETQLSLPVSRTKLLLQKLLASIVIICIASLGAVVGSVIALALLHESLDLVHLLEFTANCVLLSVVYGLIAFAVAAVTGRRGLAIGIGSGVAFGSYLLDSMAPSVSFLGGVDKLLFFHYYQNDPLVWRNIIVLLATCLILLVISFIGFNGRDIRAN